VLDGGVFPSLGESSVVPDVTVVGETVPDESEFTLLDILLDGVEGLILGDLKLGVGPSRDFNDHVEDGLGLVGKEGNVVERRDDFAILLNEHSVFKGVGGADLPGLVLLGSHFRYSM